MPRWDRRGDCPPERCQGHCCRHVVVWYEHPTPRVESWLYQQQVRQGTEDCVKQLPNGTYALDLPQRCEFLTDNNLCALHPAMNPPAGYPPRPEVCDDGPFEPAGLIFDGPEGEWPGCGFTFVLVDDEGNEIDEGSVDPATIRPYGE